MRKGTRPADLEPFLPPQGHSDPLALPGQDLVSFPVAGEPQEDVHYGSPNYERGRRGARLPVPFPAPADRTHLTLCAEQGRRGLEPDRLMSHGPIPHRPRGLAPIAEPHKSPVFSSLTQSRGIAAPCHSPKTRRSRRFGKTTHVRPSPPGRDSDVSVHGWPLQPGACPVSPPRHRPAGHHRDPHRIHRRSP